MSLITLSRPEQEYILSGIQHDIRADGRACHDYRHITLETGVLSNTDGSARLQLANTDILVGVKVDLGEPDHGKPNDGVVHFSVDCSASASPLFEGRGGEVLSTELKMSLDRLIVKSKAFNTASLCILPKEKVWHLYVDVIVLMHGGNLHDSISLAVRAALSATSIPRVTVSDNDGVQEMEVSDDPNECDMVDITNIPIWITLTKVGQNHVVDATLEEEACTMAKVMIGINQNGSVCAIQQSGAGSFDPSAMQGMIESGCRIGSKLLHSMDNLLQVQADVAYPKLGFLSTGN